MADTKRNTQHEYITLTVVFPVKNRWNLTWSYRGFKISAPQMDTATARALMDAADCHPGPLLPTWINDVEAEAKLATSPADFLARVKVLRAKHTAGFAAADKARRDEFAAFSTTRLDDGVYTESHA